MSASVRQLWPKRSSRCSEEYRKLDWIGPRETLRCLAEFNENFLLCGIDTKEAPNPRPLGRQAKRLLRAMAHKWDIPGR